MEILWKGQFTNSPKLCGNCVFLQNFQTMKLGEMTVPQFMVRLSSQYLRIGFEFSETLTSAMLEVRIIRTFYDFLTRTFLHAKSRIRALTHQIFFETACFFCDHFEELQTVLIKVKLIINNAPLTYVYPNTIKTYLTPNHLLFGRQLLCYSNTTSAVIRNLTVLSSTTDKINCISNHFWHRWRHEYVANLHETQRASKLNTNSQNYVVLVYDEKVPIYFWRIAIVTGVLPNRGSDTKKEQ